MPAMTVVLAHPLTEPGGLGVPPLFAAAVVIALAVLVGLRWPVRGRATAPDGPDGDQVPGPGLVPGPGRVPGLAPVPVDPPPGVLARVLRLAGVALLVLVVVAGRVGRDSQVDNIAPSLAIGVTWPLLLGAALVWRDPWRWVNPFDTLAGWLDALAGRDDDHGGDGPLPGGAWWAVPAAVAWCWYLGINPDVLEPRVVGLALAGYTLVTLAACQVVGRRRWLRHGEVFTVLFTTVAALRRGEPRDGAGLPVVVGVLAGGLAFSTMRFSELWIQQLAGFGVDPFADASTLPGMAVTMALVAWAVRGATRWSRSTGATPGLVAGATAVVVAGIGLAQGMLRERLVKAAVLVVARASNPLGGDADVFGTAELLPRNTILGEDTRVLVQLAVLLVAASLAIVAVRRRDAAPSVIRPALVVVGALTGIGVLAVTAV